MLTAARRWSLVVLCAVHLAARADEIRLPAPAGPFAVGRMALPPQSDPSRDEPFTADAADRRQILLHVWYPAERSGNPPAPYVEGVGDEAVFERAYSFVGRERLREVRPHAVADAPVAGGRERYPVILFSHGLGSVSFLYTSLLEDLASRGYIVVGVEHPFFSSALQLPDGRIVKNESKRPWFEGEPTAEQRATLIRIREEEALVQAADLQFAVTVLRDAAGPLSARMDLGSIGVFGHSRGGFAAAHACSADARFDACLNLDGYRLTEAVMTGGLRQPYMHIEEGQPAYTASEEQDVREQRATFRRMQAGMDHLLVAGAAHASFSDSPFIAPDKYPKIAIDAERALAITRAYIAAFFGRHLKEEAAPLLAGPSVEYPEATLILYRPSR